MFNHVESEVLVKNPRGEIKERLKLRRMTGSNDTDLRINSQREAT